MWYVIQTITGKEMETAGVIRKMLMERSYRRCFVIRHECVWRLGGELKIHTEPLFPSYVFIETDTPEAFFYELKRGPKLTKLLRSEESFWTVDREEERFLRDLIGVDPEYVIRRVLVRVNETGEIEEAEGVLRSNLGRIVKKRLRKRVVVIEIPFLGEMRLFPIGIRLEGDRQR